MMRIKIIEIGFGLHAKRIYGSALEVLGSKFNTELSLVVDLKQKEQDLRDYFKSSKLKPELLFIDPFVGKLPKKVEEVLTKYVTNNKIRAVIISTEPTTHFVYAKWALGLGLNILMDKPITTRNNAVSEMKSAEGILYDYQILLNKYNDIQKKKLTAFTINTQRRYHPGFAKVKELLVEIAQKTNCPVTSIQSAHCDGQWRLPNEMVTQGYHPYNSGYGKASHSGYHLFDAVYQFYKVSKLTNKLANSMEIYSSFVQPQGFLYQLTQDDYIRYFGKDYLLVKKYTDKKLFDLFHDYGEIDLSTIIRLKKGQKCIGNISINLLHNGFARRSWMKPGSDLYKGNGRVKHEYYSIEQGPFQNIQIHSYQSNDKHDFNTDKDYELGGNNHFDIYVFRNKDMTGDKKPLNIIKINDLKNSAFGSENNNKLITELAKHKVVAEFLGFLQGTVTREKLFSNIDDHLVPVQMMSGVYQSHNKYIRGQNPLVSFNLSL